MLTADREHTSRARRRIVDRADDAGLREHVVVLDEDQVDHEADDFTRSEVLTGRLVREFRELADQLLEGETHSEIVDLVWRYCRKLVTAGSGGSGLSVSADVLDPIGKRDTADHLRQVVMTVEPSPALLGGLGQLEDHGERGLVRQAAL